MKKKTNKRVKAFTLIELLAVIVILAVIALITTPIIIGIIESTNKKAYTESLRFLIAATNNYVAGNEFNDIPKGGMSPTDENIEMQNKSFISGKIYRSDDGKIILDTVSDGKYCGSGILEDLKVVKGSCYQLDTTSPTINDISIGLVTSKSIQVIVNASDLESGISKYYYSKDNGKTYELINSNTHTFDLLKDNQEYIIKVKVVNGNDLETTSVEKAVRTKELLIPTYKVDKEGWQQQKVITINYPTGTNFKYSYSLNGGTSWITASQNQKVTFTSNGSIMARVTDNTNIASASPLTVNQIDTTAPICGSITGSSTTWTGSDRTISIGCSDNGECSKETFTQVFNTTATTSNIIISDKASNTTTCPVDVYVDKTKYAISITNTAGGTINTSVNSAVMGDKVVVTASPLGGYALTDLKWNNISISNGGSFEMPRANVNITASWRKLELPIYPYYYGFTQNIANFSAHTGDVSGSGSASSIAYSTVDIDLSQYRTLEIKVCVTAASSTYSSGYGSASLVFQYGSVGQEIGSAIVYAENSIKFSTKCFNPIIYLNYTKGTKMMFTLSTARSGNGIGNASGTCQIESIVARG